MDGRSTDTPAQGRARTEATASGARRGNDEKTTEDADGDGRSVDTPACVREFRAVKAAAANESHEWSTW